MIINHIFKSYNKNYLQRDKMGYDEKLIKLMGFINNHSYSLFL